MEWKMAPSGMAAAAGNVIAELIRNGHEAYWGRGLYSR
jgi:hypothetical protein